MSDPVEESVILMEVDDGVVEVINERVVVMEVEIDEPSVIEIEVGQQGAQGEPGPVDTQYSDDLMTTHIMDPTPHPEYDDMPPLTLLFENGLI